MMMMTPTQRRNRRHTSLLFNVVLVRDETFISPPLFIPSSFPLALAVRENREAREKSLTKEKEKECVCFCARKQ